MGDIPQQVERIAVCATDFPNLGDQIALLPLFDGLSRRFPGSRILLAGRFAQTRVGEDLGFTHETQLYRRADRELLRKVRRFAPDVCVCLRRTSFRANLCFGRASGAGLTIGFAGGLNRFVHDRLVPYRPLIYRPRRDMIPLESFDTEGDLVGTVRRVGSLGKREAEQGQYAVVMPGGSIPEKRWSPQRYAAVVNGVARHHPQVRWLVVLGPTEVALGIDAVFRRTAPQVELLTDLGLPDLARLFLGARVVLANDCGPAHLAQMGGVAIVQPFGNWDGAADERIAWWFDNRRGAICLTTRGSAPIDSIPEKAMIAAALRLLNAPEQPGRIVHTDREEEV